MLKSTLTLPVSLRSNVNVLPSLDTLPLVTKLFLRPVTLAVKPFVPVRFAVPSPLAWYVAVPPVMYLSLAVTMRLISPILAPFVMTSPPLATFVICLLPALIPLLLITTSPTVTLSKLGFLLTATVNFLAAVSYSTIALSFAANSSVSPALIGPSLLPAFTLKPDFSFSTSSALAMLLIVTVLAGEVGLALSSTLRSTLLLVTV